MHRVHHSVENDEMNTNFGFNLPWWDYMFKTYTWKEFNKQDDLVIGIRNMSGRLIHNIFYLLIQPFKKVN